MAGFLLSDLYVARKSLWSHRGYLYDGLALIGYVLAFFVIPPHLNSPIAQVGYVTGLSLVFFGGFTGRVFSAFLRIPIVCVIGGMCYTIYLLHGRIITCLYAYFLKNVQLTGSYLLDHTILNVHSDYRID